MQESILIYFSMNVSILLIIIIFGFLMDLLERLSFSYGAAVFNKKALVIISSYIGTPIHELGHLFFAIIFGHTITKIQLIPTKESLAKGNLGYVQHSYNQKNFYQKFGNFFIGIGPMFSGPIAILVILKLLLPETYTELYNCLLNIFSLNESALSIFIIMIKAIFSMFTFSNLGNIKFYIFLFLSINIAAHMGLSISDIKHSLFSLIFLIIIIVAISFIVSIFPKINSSLIALYSFLSAIFSLSIILSLFNFLFFKIIFRITK